MPFRVKKSEPAGRAVRRLSRERLGEARECLRHGERPSAIHGARKEIKKLRALLQLVRGAISQPTYRKARKPLRGAAGELAAPRDARVMLKAFASLTGSGAKKYPTVRAALIKQAARRARSFRNGGAASRAEKLLRRAGHRMDEIKLQSSGWTAFAPGLESCYRRGAGAFKLAQREPQPENFHAWRRHVKLLWYGLCILRPAWTAATRRRLDALERLGEILGGEHDLLLLDEFLRKPDFAPETGGLIDLIADKRRRLQATALKLGARLYARESSAFCRDLQSEWNDWRGAGKPGRRRK
jgi:CHAD domain-containing protein